MTPERTVIPDDEMNASAEARWLAFRYLEQTLKDHGGEWVRDESIPAYVWKPVPTLVDKPEGGA